MLRREPDRISSPVAVSIAHATTLRACTSRPTLVRSDNAGPPANVGTTGQTRGPATHDNLREARPTTDTYTPSRDPRHRGMGTGTQSESSRRQHGSSVLRHTPSTRSRPRVVSVPLGGIDPPCQPCVQCATYLPHRARVTQLVVRAVDAEAVHNPAHERRPQAISV